MEVKWCLKMDKGCLSVCPSQSDCSKVLSRKIYFILPEELFFEYAIICKFQLRHPFYSSLKMRVNRTNNIDMIG